MPLASIHPDARRVDHSVIDPYGYEVSVEPKSITPRFVTVAHGCDLRQRKPLLRCCDLVPMVSDPVPTSLGPRACCRDFWQTQSSILQLRVRTVGTTRAVFRIRLWYSRHCEPLRPFECSALLVYPTRIKGAYQQRLAFPCCGLSSYLIRGLRSVKLVICAAKSTTNGMLEEAEGRLAEGEAAVSAAGKIPAKIQLPSSSIGRYLEDLRGALETDTGHARRLLAKMLGKAILGRDGPRLLADIKGNLLGLLDMDEEMFGIAGAGSLACIVPSYRAQVSWLPPINLRRR